MRELDLPMYIVCNLCKNTGKRVVPRAYGYAEIRCEYCWGRKEPLPKLELELRSNDSEEQRDEE